MNDTIERQSTEQEHGQLPGSVVYIGLRCQGRLIVRTVATDDELPLGRGLEVRDHSPTGYSGSGLAQLALAIRLEYTDDEDIAFEYYTRFTDTIVSQLERTGPTECWQLSVSEIEAVLRDGCDLEVMACV